MTSMIQRDMMMHSGPNEVKLIDRMKEATREIHNVVENRQFIQDLMKGKVTDASYLQYLVDLKYIYEAIELELELNKDNPKIAAIVIPELYRTEKLNKDIEHFSNENHMKASFEAEKFRDAIRERRYSGIHLIAAYVYLRMLGDLFGGRDIGAAVRDKWGDEGACFYDYSELMEKYNIESLMKFAAMTYRPAFNKLNLTVQEEDEVIKEAVRAFELTDALLLSYERK